MSPRPFRRDRQRPRPSRNRLASIDHLASIELSRVVISSSSAPQGCRRYHGAKLHCRGQANLPDSLRPVAVGADGHRSLPSERPNTGSGSGEALGRIRPSGLYFGGFSSAGRGSKSSGQTRRPVHSFLQLAQRVFEAAPLAITFRLKAPAHISVSEDARGSAQPAE
jgi:hypothetical protein